MSVRWLRRTAIAAALGAAGVLLAPGCGKNSPTDSGNQNIDPADYVTTIDNTYRPLVPGTVFIYEGEDGEERERIVVEVTEERKTILGVSCVVVRDRVWVDGELVEDTRDWHAQHVNGDLWYLGEDVKNYEDGELVDTEGSWEAGVDGAEAGVLVPAEPVIGRPYRQEYYEGEAEDMAEALSITASVTVPYGEFMNCLQTKDWTPLEPGIVEHKFYAPGVGPVLEVLVEGGSGRVELVDRLGLEARPPAGEFTTEIDHPFFPLSPGTTLVYEGESDGEHERIVVEITGETRVVQGVMCVVVRDRVWVDDELVEDTYDWYAQHASGDLWYFGEDVKNYEGGFLVDTHGSWEAGANGARAGVLLPADPPADEPWRQEFYAGEAEDMSRLLGVGESVAIEMGTYDGCLRTYEWTPLEPGFAEEKVFAPGIGMVLETVVQGGEGRIELVEIIHE